MALARSAFLFPTSHAGRPSADFRQAFDRDVEVADNTEMRV
jgi:hypothetical protein